MTTPNELFKKLFLFTIPISIPQKRFTRFAMTDFKSRDALTIYPSNCIGHACMLTKTLHKKC